LEVGGVHALHDPTEGGLATGLWELAEASGVGLVIDEHRVPVLLECDALCTHFGLSPWGLIASGALLISAARLSAAAIVERLHGEGIVAAEIGEIVPRERGCRLRSVDGTGNPLSVFSRDEIARLFDSLHRGVSDS
jgi:hydrogenase maturation factor